MKQTLWIVSELFPPDETSTAYILGEVANAMAEKYIVKVISGPEIYDKRKKVDPKNQFRLNSSIEVYRVQTKDVDKNKLKGKIRNILISSYKLYGMAKKQIKKGDKVLAVTNPFPLVVIMAFLKWRKGFELNILVHDIFPENAKPSNIYIPCLPIVKYIFGKAYSNADRLIALGRDMKDVLENKTRSFKSHPQIIIIENWAEIDSIIPIERERGNEITIQYAGNIGRGRGLETFFYCLQKAGNPSLRLELYGSGSVEDKLKKMADNEQMNNISFHGTYYRSEQCKVLNDCDLALITLGDGLYGLGVPSKSYNIMAAGKACLYIGHPESEIALLIKEYNLGYVFSPSDEEGIVNFLSNLSKNDIPQFKEMGYRARRLVEKNYKKDVILEKFVETI